MQSDLKVSILIPTLNAGKNWTSLLEGINSQSATVYKKIIIDSGSTDNTVKHALKYGFEVKSIRKSDFNHGKVRQQLVNMAADTDICVFFTQDAIPASIHSVKNLVQAFEDARTGLAYGRQLPRKNATAIESHARLFNYPESSAIKSYKDKEELGFKVCFCSNSFAAYRTIALNEAGGFPSDSIMGEDALVSAKMLIKGFKVAYVGNAAVYHSHDYSIKDDFKRYFDTRVFHEQNAWLIDEYGKPTGEGIRFLKSELKYVARNDPTNLKSIGSLGAKWLGYKSGKYYRKMSTRALQSVSMHKYYWK